MSSLSPELLERSRNVFLNCSQFENYQNLRSVFITPELQPFRIGIRQADNQADLVNLFFDFILVQKLPGGIPVFPIFLATLRTLYPEGDFRRDDLAQLCEEIQDLMQPAQSRLSYSAHQKQVLFERLMTLDFRSQVRQFREVIEHNRIASFLIHGPPNHRQRVLTHRLTRLKPEWEVGQRILIDAGSNGTGKSTHSLWRQVAKQMQLPHDTNITILAEKVCQWWQTQDVIFIFYTVDYIPQEILSAWIEEFWKPISTTAYLAQHLTKAPTHLLLFLIDFDGHIHESNIKLLDRVEEMTNSYTPIKLPIICEFPENELEFWIDSAAEVLPTNLKASELMSTTENGIPELVYEKICEYCGLSWEGEITP